MLSITSFYAGLLALLFLALSFRVIASRRANRISLGDAQNKDLRQRMRAHGNFAEYAPLGLVLLACAEMQSTPSVLVHLLGLLLLVGRSLHAAAFWVHPMILKFRIAGMLTTFTMIGLSGALLLINSLF